MGTVSRNVRGRWFLAAILAVPLALAACAAPAPTQVPAATAALGTITPGVLTVAIAPYAPYTSMQGDTMVGLDADILNAAAAKLGLQVKPVVTDFAGMLASVQSRRVDVTIGGVAWTADRQKQGLFTDPPYYSPPAMAVRPGTAYPTVASLQGKNLGTVDGYVWVKSIQDVPGAALHVYPDAPSVFSDLASGRIDAGFLDPLIIIAAQKANAGAALSTAYLTPPSADDVKSHPSYSYFQPYMTGFYLPKEEAALQEALDKQIDAMYADGSLAALVTKYGGVPEQFLKPTPDMSAQRRGVDRPATWTPPSV